MSESADTGPWHPWPEPDAEQLTSALRALEQGVQFWDQSGHLVYANPVTQAHFGQDSLAAPGIHWQDWLPHCVDERGVAWTAEDFPIGCLLNGKPFASQILLRLTLPDGKKRWVRLQVSPYRGSGRGVVITSTLDVTRLMEQEERLQYETSYDLLTGLPNRALFLERLKRAMIRTRHSRDLMAICLLDLDGFKAVNDLLGHDAGNQLLQEIARRLAGVLRTDDTVSRLSGDEFALLLGGFASPEAVEGVLTTLLEKIAAPCLVAGREAYVSASIGVTLFPIDHAEADQLLRHADQAMYLAKQTGKNRFSIFDPVQEFKVKASQAALKKIGEAIDRDEFCLFYQPKVDCRQGQVVGLEALIRWRHPILGLRLPGEFLPLIEHDDLITRLGEWVVKEALRQLGRLHTANRPLSISVNVSAHQLQYGKFEERLGEILAEFPPHIGHCLELEIVETAALEEMDQVSRLITRYRSQNIHFSLDDFGTGYSSLVHLKYLPVDVLKIDQTFVRDMLTDPGDLAIVQGIVGLASAFQRQVVAEGVESVEHIQALLHLGCDVMQGDAIACPLPEEDLFSWLQDFRPDPSWNASPGALNGQEEFRWLFLEVAHRQWLNRLRREGPAALPPCRFAQWLDESDARRRYSEIPLFQALLQAHHDFHACVTQWSAGKGLDTALGDETALTAAHEKFIGYLKQFRPNLAENAKMFSAEGKK